MERTGSNTDHESAHLEALLDHLDELGEEAEDTVSVGQIFEVVGTRSFAPLLMLVGMLIASPLSGIPVFPTTVAAVILLVTLQMLVGRKHFWLPDRLLRVTVPGDKLTFALKWLKPPARFVDRITMPRLHALVCGPSIYVIAIICLLIAVLMPMMEFIPFSSSAAGVVFMAFGVSLVSRDGLVALIAYASTAVIVGLLVYAFI